MKKSICLYFQVYQPTRLRQYRFFDIGKDSHYFDDFANRTAVKKVAQRCYLPMNEILLREIEKNKGAFKLALSISGSTLELLDRYAPEALDSFRALAATGCVEFLCETYYHSLASLASPAEFRFQVETHKEAVKKYLGVEPVTFRNTELIYSDSIGKEVADLGFKTMLVEGAKHLMGWRSSDYVYSNELRPELKLLVRNYGLSDDIAMRFADRSWNEWPLTAEKYAGWLASAEGEIHNIFMNYETFGEYVGEETGILDFMGALPSQILAHENLEFVTPAEASAKHEAVSTLDAQQPVSWADEERDLSAWLGNDLQKDAFRKLYGLQEKLSIINDPVLWSDYGHLQESNHFYYMSTKFFSGKEGRNIYNPYDTPYEAFINYMNAVSDFIIRVDNHE